MPVARCVASALLVTVLLAGMAVPSAAQAAWQPYAAVNFQPAAAPTCPGYLTDGGATYADRGNGFSYGWNAANSAATRDRNAAGSPSQCHDTLTHLQKAPNAAAAWEIGVPPGTYRVRVVSGDPSHVDSVYRVAVEGVLAVSGTPTSANRWIEGTVEVAVTDGRLTVGSAAGASNNKLAFLVVERPAVPPLDVDVNFASPTAPIPAGFVADVGQPYGARGELSYGWVLPGTTTPLDLSVGGTTPGNGRDRNAAGVPQELDTLVHMQGGDVASFNGTPVEGAWELAVPPGTYLVEAAVGDPAHTDSAHTLNVEGRNLLHRFTPAAAQRHQVVTALVRVVDGRLTLTATGGTNTKINYVRVTAQPAEDGRPAVLSTLPANQATGQPLDVAIGTTLDIVTSGGGVDPATLSDGSVVLETVAGARVPIRVGTSGGRDTITATPATPLAAGTTYRFTVTDSVRDVTGAAFVPFTSILVTGAGATPPPPTAVRFTPVGLGTAATGHAFSSVAFGPDGKLYAATLTGELHRFTLAADGTIASEEVITSVRAGNGGDQRMIVGLAFDPAATAADPVLWVSHSTFGFGDMPDWGGKVSRLSGPDLATYQDYVVDLPRSSRDHLTNSLAFHDGLLYLSQGSNSAMGAPDNPWSNRPERALSAAVVEIDPAAIPSPPLDVRTEDGGTYDPFAAGAPVRVFGSGIRNAFDLVWHSNGSLYVPANGSAGGGATPGTPSPLPPACAARVDGAPYTGGAVPAIADQPVTQNDLLFRVVRGGYYGHPNPSRCEWVLNGGNPTAGTDALEVTAYPVGTAPDPNWRGAVYDFSNNKSPNGALEYTSDRFGAALRGALLVTRYSQNDDVIALFPGADGAITRVQTGIPGLTGLADPLDLTLNPANGDLYLSAGVGSTSPGTITLLRATPQP
jgi:hypothetical protein